LLGVILRCDGGYEAVTPESIQRILELANSFEGQLLRRYGFRTEPLTAESIEYFGADHGLLVTETSGGWPAAEAGLMPGDIIQALDDVPVNTMDDIARLFLPVAEPSAELSVWRNRQSRRLSVALNSGEFPAAGARIGPGIVLRSSQEGYLIEEVVPGSSADLAGIQAGDSLLLVGGQRPRSLEAASKVISQGLDSPVYVVVQRGQTRLGAYLR
jgi:S1-C subfamily serine protease